MQGFVEIRRVLLKENDMKDQLKQIKGRLGEHDAQLKESGKIGGESGLRKRVKPHTPVQKPMH